MDLDRKPDLQTTTPPELPPVHEADLDWPTVDQLFADITALGEVLGISIKGAARGRAQEGGPDLKRAYDCLQGGLSIQLRYRFEGVEWWDTLMRTPDGVRLVRIGHTWGDESCVGH